MIDGEPVGLGRYRALRLFGGKDCWALVAAVAPQEMSTRKADMKLPRLATRHHDAHLVSEARCRVLNTDLLVNVEGRQLTSVMVVVGCDIMCPLGCTAIALLRLGLPFNPDGRRVGWHTGGEGSAVEDLSREATSVVRGASDFKEAPVELLAAYIACGSYLHDKVLHGLYSCLGVAVGLRIVG